MRTRAETLVETSERSAVSFTKPALSTAASAEGGKGKVACQWPADVCDNCALKPPPYARMTRCTLFDVIALTVSVFPAQGNGGVTVA